MQNYNNLGENLASSVRLGHV